MHTKVQIFAVVGESVTGANIVEMMTSIVDGEPMALADEFIRDVVLDPETVALLDAAGVPESERYEKVSNPVCGCDVNLTVPAMGVVMHFRAVDLDVMAGPIPNDERGDAPEPNRGVWDEINQPATVE